MDTLICTVGGSHQPIIKAIRDNEPDFILFVCSCDDPTSGEPGSYEHIEKAGIFLKQDRNDAKPTLPNIPTQVGLDESSYQVLKVYADDLDFAYRSLAECINGYVERGDTILVDYTGGTKTMSAALCLAALDHDEISLQLVTGVRSDLHKVKDGTEESQTAEIGRTRFAFKAHQAMEAWQQFAYDDTVQQLKKQKPTHKDDKLKLTAIRQLSQAFSLWDRFEHADAYVILQRLARYESVLQPYLNHLRDLCREGNKRQTPALLMDLWLNTKRRVQQQRFDDATSRAYRLTEWTAQWLLEAQAGIKSSNVPADKIPEGMTLEKNPKGEYLASLIQSWQLAAAHCHPDVAEFWGKHEKHLKHWLQIRNYSILAHGFEPVSAEKWSQIEAFMEEWLLPLILSQVKNLGIQQLPQQLPQTFRFDV